MQSLSLGVALMLLWVKYPHPHRCFSRAPELQRL